MVFHLKMLQVKWNEWRFRPQFCIHKAILGQGQHGLMRWILLWILPLVQDQSLGLLTSSPACYYCTTKPPHHPVVVRTLNNARGVQYIGIKSNPSSTHQLYLSFLPSTLTLMVACLTSASKSTTAFFSVSIIPTTISKNLKHTKNLLIPNIHAQTFDKGNSKFEMKLNDLYGSVKCWSIKSLTCHVYLYWLYQCVNASVFFSSKQHQNNNILLYSSTKILRFNTSDVIPINLHSSITSAIKIY